MTTTPVGIRATEQDIELINQLFANLKAIFPAWKSAFQKAGSYRLAKENWLQGLIDAGISDWSTIEAGLRAARKSNSPFMPSIGEFLSWCKGQDNDIPNAVADVTWVRDAELREESKAHFIDKYGFFVERGRRFFSIAAQKDFKVEMRDAFVFNKNKEVNK